MYSKQDIVRLNTIHAPCGAWSYPWGNSGGCWNMTTFRKLWDFWKGRSGSCGRKDSSFQYAKPITGQEGLREEAAGPAAWYGPFLEILSCGPAVPTLEAPTLENL